MESETKKPQLTSTITLDQQHKRQYCEEHKRLNSNK